MGAEHDRIASFGRPEDGIVEASPWYLWGPYLAERQWGTVREDYSADGDAWASFPHEHARGRTYRWGEDGLAGICDAHQQLCFALALWNGVDPILKERLFGLTGHEGNHGEDAKEVWWHLDAVPSHAWLRYRYHYPQTRFPYEGLVAASEAAGLEAPEPELYDLGAFDEGRFWVVDVTYAKATPDDILVELTLTNAGPDKATLHVLPTLWFRNTWAWGDGEPHPRLGREGDAIVADHPVLGRYALVSDSESTQLYCDNETNMPRLFGGAALSPYPKDGIDEHVRTGAATVNPALEGTKAAFHHVVTVESGADAKLRLRLARRGEGVPTGVGDEFDEVVACRRSEADEFHQGLRPSDADPEEALVLRRALAGMIWCKQYYGYDVQRWLEGDPVWPPPSPGRGAIRNGGWKNLDAADVLSMPDSWEYPWFATWDLAFHTIPLARIDPGFAKSQLLAIVREWFQHPNGALPAYEWSFDDVNPPVHAWAAMRVFEIDGRRDRRFLERVFHKLLLNFAWWVNRKDEANDNLFEGGFLGLDNIGPFDRSKVPVAGRLEQSDATGWMAFYALAMAEIAVTLSVEDEVYVDLAAKFLLHFDSISRAMNQLGIWDADEGFYFDRLVCPGGDVVPLRVHSIVGLIPLLAAIHFDPSLIAAVPTLRRRLAAVFERSHGSLEDALQDMAGVGHVTRSHDDGLLLSVAGPARVRRLLTSVLDEQSFLSPYGLRSLSRWHKEHPFEVEVEGYRAVVGYEPAESRSGLFGGNSNWRGPVWFPFNYLVIDALERYHAAFGDSFTVEFPTGSGRQATLGAIADDLRARLVSLFVPDAAGRRPCFGDVSLFTEPRWREPLFYEYFDGETGAGLGASHQTGWTGLVAELVIRRRR